MTLHRLPRRHRAAIAESAEGDFPGRLVFDVILLGNDRPTGLEHERAEAELRQLFRRPPAGHPRTDHDGVEIGVGHTGAQPS